MNTKEQTFIIKQYATSSKAFPTIKFEMPESSSLDDVIEAFEAFLIGATYELPKGAKLGLIYEEETEKKKVEEKYGLTTDSAPATPQTMWPETWSITHPILSESIGSIIPATTWSTTTTTNSGCDKPSKKKKKAAKKKKKAKE